MSSDKQREFLNDVTELDLYAHEIADRCHSQNQEDLHEVALKYLVRAYRLGCTVSDNELSVCQDKENALESKEK